MGEISRRDFLKLSAGTAAFVALAAVGVKATAVKTPETPPLPDAINTALHQEFGDFAAIVTAPYLLQELSASSVVAIGEAHFDPRDMETAVELINILTKKNQLALALERFSGVLQPLLEELYRAPENNINSLLDQLFQSDEYRLIWGETSSSLDSSRLAVVVDAANRLHFEQLVRWAAHSRIPMIGLDISLAERKNKLDADMPFRNSVWAQNIHQFKIAHPKMTFQYVAVGGIQHMHNGAGSFPHELKKLPLNNITSVGQRDAKTSSPAIKTIEREALTAGLTNVIVKKPQMALNDASYLKQLSPPDYWIAYHKQEEWR
jgi:hypothetical protein